MRRLAVHSARVAMVVAVVVLIHLQHRRLDARRRLHPIEVSDLSVLFPNAHAIGDADANGLVAVKDVQGEDVGFVVQTSPASDHIVGFSGPTNVAIGFGADERIVGMAILSSGDTRDHVRQIQEDPRFLSAFDGLTWDEAAGASSVDAVSGATLTSIAIVESIINRLGGSQPSLRFPEPVTIDAARSVFPEAANVHEDDSSLLLVTDHNGQPLGRILRTSPAADSIVGYQGPTDSLVALDSESRVAGVAVGSSFDNEPYVGYVRDDEYFRSWFNGRTLDELATLDIDEAGVEGVSGATMTSMAVADGLVVAARDRHGRRDNPAGGESFVLSVTARDIGTLAVAALGCLIALTSLRGQADVQLALRLLVVACLGFMNGDMVSQALLVGWAQAGIPWQNACGLVALTGAAVVLPITAGRNVYCSHLCAHGAAQQLIRNRLPWRVTLPRRAVRCLRYLPAALLVWVVIVAMTGAGFSLVDIEPFDAYVLTVAGGAAIAIAVVGLVASLFVPMAYCRYGCPTGALLGFLRRHSRSDRLSSRDAFAAGLLVLAAVLHAI